MQEASDEGITMHVLVIGSGGREHALAWKMAQSPLVTRLSAAPGNPGIAEVADLVVLNVADHASVLDFCKREAVGLVVVGPEAPLVAGLVDDLRAESIPVFGPTKAAAQLEGSKGFTKDLCREAGIPTAAYERFTDVDAARAYVRQQGAPIVIKADGLAAGKGVVVAMTLPEALEAIEAMFAGSMGEAGHSVVIEDFLEGEEASFFVLTDGTHALPLTSAQDHKRVGDGDTGPNTGGMGAYSPAPVLTSELEAVVMERIIYPTLQLMKQRGTPYTGVLYAGLMLTSEGPQLIEYNARFGDPETQVLMMRLVSDLVPLLLATDQGGLEACSVVWDPQPALGVVMVNQGYPGAIVSGAIIQGLDGARAVEGVQVFHAGTAMEGGQLVAKGGRVLNINAKASTLKQAQTRAYQAVDAIDWSTGFCRRDIGWRAIR